MSESAVTVRISLRTYLISRASREVDGTDDSMELIVQAVDQWFADHPEYDPDWVATKDEWDGRVS